MEETKEQRYDRIYNEGHSDGYNPYRKQSEEPIYWQLSGKEDRLLDIMAGTSTADPRYAQLERDLAGVRAALASGDYKPD